MIHEYINAIGFSKIRKNAEMYRLLDQIAGQPDDKCVLTDTEGNEVVFSTKRVNEDMGITMVGTFLSNNEYRMTYYYPYFTGSRISTTEITEIEEYSSKNSFSGLCDDLKFGMTLIFYIINAADVMREQKKRGPWLTAENTVLSGLALEGKILLPVEKSRNTVLVREEESQKRLEIMEQARKGDMGAIEDLTLQDMDLYETLNNRLKTQDILTIVESTLIPYGMESDQYTVIGEIENCYKVSNEMTGETLWVLSLICNDMKFDVCINEKDLLGEPQSGRRFKGRIWLQGYVNIHY